MMTKVLEDRLEPEDRVLDVGTKDGRKFKQIDAEVVATDIELRPELDHIQYAYADGGRLPFVSNTFDHVVCTQVLEHVPHERALVEEMSRVLRFDGTLYLNFPNRLFPDQPHSPPGCYSVLPRGLGSRLAPYLLDESTSDYYRESVFNISPVRARWLLHRNFGDIEYVTMKHKDEFKEIFLGEEPFERYEPSRAGKLIARSLPVLRPLMQVPPIGALVELLYPAAEYVCRHPKRA